jgi:RHS repeat-associated protein
VLALIVSPLGVAQAAETVTYYYTSPQGTVLATGDSAGNILTSADYRPYGGQALGTPEDGPGYAGHVNDTGSSLVYMQARYYDPETGRFLSMDPVAVAPGDLFASRYAYANNNPIGNIDPDGRQSCVAEGCTVGPTPYNFFQDNFIGQIVGHTLGDPIALARADNINPITNQALDGGQQQDAKLAMLTVLFPAGRGEVVAGEVVQAGMPLIKIGSAGGETAGKAFTEAVKDAARAENPKAICVFCRREGMGTQVDHAVPRARGGNATIDNAQMACPHCNPSKGAGDYPKNPPPGYEGDWPPDHWTE